MKKLTESTPEITIFSLEKINITYALNLIQSNMACYYEKYDLKWDDDNFRKNEWEKTDNYGIRYLPNDCVVGIVRIAWNDIRTECYLKDLQIESDFQGKGIGTRYLELLKLYAKNEGCNMTRLRVFIDSPAITLYKRFGFVQTGKTGYLLEMALSI